MNFVLFPNNCFLIGDYAQKAIEEVPNRTHCYCFKTDGYRIAFMKVCRDSDSGTYNYYATDYYNYFDEGYKHLFDLLNSSLDDLGWSSPRFESDNMVFQVTDKIAYGRTSSTWLTSSQHVIKRYYKTYLQSKETEISILKTLYGIEAIPSLTAVGQNFIAISPFGKSFHGFTSKSQLKDFIRVLQEVHQRNVIHRDIRQSNLIVYENRVYLIDWGYAVIGGNPEKYAGGLWCAANEILTSESEKITSIPQHDLIMFLKMFFGLLNPRVPEHIQNEYNDLKTRKDRIECANFWKIQFTDPFWSTCLGYCENLNYEYLGEYLGNLLAKF